MRDVLTHVFSFTKFNANPGILDDNNLEEPTAGWWEWMFGSSETTNNKVQEGTVKCVGCRCI